jgi:hypothetical protein
MAKALSASEKVKAEEDQTLSPRRGKLVAALNTVTQTQAALSISWCGV